MTLICTNGKESKKSELIEKIYKEFINRNKFPEKDTFIANHSQHIALLDELANDGVLQVRDNCYKLHLNEIIKLGLWKRDGRIANKILARLKEARETDPKAFWPITDVLPKDELGLEPNDIKRAFYYLNEAGFISSAPEDPETKEIIGVKPHEDVFRYNTIEDNVHHFEKIRKENDKKILSSQAHHQKLAPTLKDNKRGNLWIEIKSEYGVSKRQLAKLIRPFVLDQFKQKIIFRDIVQAHSCLKSGYYKPAVILAGGVIEELLRLYLKHKGYAAESGRFYDYIKMCRDRKLLKASITQLTGAVKDFRNQVHLKEEETERHSISKTTAASAVNAIFTISNDFH